MVGPESFQPEASVKSFRSPLGPGAQRTPAVARRSPPVKIGRPEGKTRILFTGRSAAEFDSVDARRVARTCSQRSFSVRQ